MFLIFCIIDLLLKLLIYFFADWIGVAFLTCNNDVICLNVHFCLIRIHILIGVTLVIVGFFCGIEQVITLGYFVDISLFY